jgi:hypothetical protein
MGRRSVAQHGIGLDLPDAAFRTVNTSLSQAMSASAKSDTRYELTLWYPVRIQCSNAIASWSQTRGYGDAQGSFRNAGPAQSSRLRAWKRDRLRTSTTTNLGSWQPHTASLSGSDRRGCPRLTSRGRDGVLFPEHHWDGRRRRSNSLVVGTSAKRSSGPKLRLPRVKARSAAAAVRHKSASTWSTPGRKQRIGGYTWPAGPRCCLLIPSADARSAQGSFRNTGLSDRCALL